MRSRALRGAWLAVVVAACAPAESAPTTATVPAVSAAPLGAPAPSGPSAPASPNLLTIRIVDDRLELGASPSFTSGKDELLTSPENDAWLATVVDYMNRHPEVTKLRVEAHTDGQGASAFDDRLSQDRADRLVGALVDRGIATGRLHPVGYGKTRPIAPNTTAEGRAANRRIELHVEELSGAPLAGRRPPP